MWLRVISHPVPLLKGKIMSAKGTVKKILKKCFNIGEETVDDYRKRGVRIGSNVNMYSCNIDYGHGFLIEIGDNCTITHSTILTHDASTKMYLGYSKVGRVKIGNNVFIGQGSVILPCVNIGDDVIIGAGSVVKEDIPSRSVAVGNPATVVCTLDEYLTRNKERMETAPRYDTHWRDKTEEERNRMYEDLKDGIVGYDI